MGVCLARSRSKETTAGKDGDANGKNAEDLGTTALSSRLNTANKRKSATGYQCDMTDLMAGTSASSYILDADIVESSVQHVVREYVEKVQSSKQKNKFNKELNYVNAVVKELIRKPEGEVFLKHPSLLFSNHAALACARELASGAKVGKYSVIEALPIGSVGRSYSVKCDSGTSSNRGFRVGKMVNFALRMGKYEEVLKDQYVLKNLHHANVLRCVDIIEADASKNCIFLTPNAENGSIQRFAGRLSNQPDKLKSIFHDVAIGLRVLHSHELYHNNLKLTNVLLKSSGNACVTDAGFWRLFASQSIKSLAYDGGIASKPPEVFISTKSRRVNAAKVDVWNFGILMYQMVYDEDPFNTVGKSFDEVQNMILFHEISFPSMQLPFAEQLQEVISLCLNRDPNERPSIVGLLKHGFFRCNAVRRHSIPRSIFEDSSRSGSIHFTSSAPKDLSRSLTNISGAAGLTRVYLRHGFTVDSVLGKGRHCETLLVCLRRNPMKLFTLKVMKVSLQQKMERGLGYERKIREALVFCRKVSHPNLLPILDIVKDQGGCFATQVFVDGVSVKLQFPPLIDTENPAASLKYMLFDCMCGLRYLHENGLAHLSLTPGNIFYQRGKGYILADFGPLFTMKEDILEGSEDPPWCMLPRWVLRDIIKPSSFGACVDTFCLGLLASSVVPYVSKYVWSYFETNEKDSKLNIKRIMEIITEPDYGIPEPLVDFIKMTLAAPVSVGDLQQHEYFKDIKDENILSPIVPLKFKDVELGDCIHDKFPCRDESRMLDILGQDPMEAVVTPSVVTEGSTTDTDMEKETVRSSTNISDNTTSSLLPVNDSSRFVYLPFENKIACGLCQVEMSIVLFKCPKCEKYVRCGKCSVSDKHAEGHLLEPYLIHMIEHNTNGKRALIVPPSNLQNRQALEELEMQANLPAGALTKTCSSIRSKGNVAPGPTGGGFTRGVSGIMSKMKKTQSKKLPKASEVDDSSWEEEIRNCREKRGAELLLYRFDLTAVPKEILDPPLTHVIHLDLSYNKLVALPHEVSFLIRLRRLGVSNNQLLELPDSIGNLSELEHLDVSHNILKDLPSTFVYLHRMGTIAMDYNDFSDIPECISELANCTASEPALTAIYMAENPRITRFPNIENFSPLPMLKLALDNEPNVYATYVKEKISEKFPNVNIMWNKIYPDCIVENVYCGSLRSAQSQIIYDKLNIKNLLTMGRGLLPSPPVGGKHQTITVDDIDGSDICGTFSDAVNFIDESVERNEGCLVHCFAGMSRSATAVIAFLMLKRGMRLDEAYCLTKRGRPAIHPNNGFFQQLLALDASLFPEQRPLDMDSMNRAEVPTA